MATPSQRIRTTKKNVQGSVSPRASGSDSEEEMKAPPALPISSFSGSMLSRFKLLEFKSMENIFKSLINKNLLDDVHRHGEIKITIPDGVLDIKSQLSFDVDTMMAIKGNCTFDVLAFMSIIDDIQNSKGDEKDLGFFDISVNGLVDEQQYLTNMRCLAFSYMIVMTRGSLPKQSGQGSDNKLPQLLIDNINMNGKTTEKDFANMLSSTNLEKIKVNWMIDISPSMFPDQIKNRILKGTAGSRALKVISQAALLYSKENYLTDDEADVFFKLVDLAKMSNCYINLHPMRQVVQTVIPQFYKSCIAISFLAVGDQNLIKLQNEMRKIQSFTNDQILNKMSIVNKKITLDGQVFNHSFTGVSADEVEKLFGSPLTP